MKGFFFSAAVALFLMTVFATWFTNLELPALGDRQRSVFVKKEASNSPVILRTHGEQIVFDVLRDPLVKDWTPKEREAAEVFLWDAFHAWRLQQRTRSNLTVKMEGGFSRYPLSLVVTASPYPH